jgi:hypothetical protein
MYLSKPPAQNRFFEVCFPNQTLCVLDEPEHSKVSGVKSCFQPETWKVFVQTKTLCLTSTFLDQTLYLDETFS